MGMSHLKIRYMYHKRGLSLKKDCVMNMIVLRHVAVAFRHFILLGVEVGMGGNFCGLI